MKTKKIILCILCISASYMSMLHAQTAVETLRYSELLPSGTARSVGVAGAMSSLGGDMGSLSVNPAGLGVYRKSEFNLTPAVQITSVGSSLNGAATMDESNATFGIENIGLVFYKGYNNSKLKAFNFGATINRVANFNRQTVYSGQTAGSVINAFQASAQGFINEELEGFTSGLAADAGAIFNLDGAYTDEWFSDFDTFEDLGIERSETITTTGGVSDLALSLGFNISHKLYLGFSGNFPIVRFEETRSYVEDDSTDDVIPFFRNLSYNQSITTTGIGLGFKAGFIYRITNEIRLGGSVHSPIRYTLSDNFTADLEYFFIDENDPSSPLIDGQGLSPDGSFGYRLRTPWRFNGGLSVVLKKFGFISLDVESFNYSDLEYDFVTNNNNSEDNRIIQAEVNSDIRRQFSNALNIKIGAEYLIKKFRLRAGYGLFGNPFNDSSSPRNVISFGAGVRGDKAYLDLAYRATVATENYSPYVSPNQFEQLVSSDINTNNIILTFGYRF